MPDVPATPAAIDDQPIQRAACRCGRPPWSSKLITMRERRWRSKIMSWPSISTDKPPRLGKRTLPDVTSSSHEAASGSAIGRNRFGPFEHASQIDACRCRQTAPNHASVGRTEGHADAGCPQRTLRLPTPKAQALQLVAIGRAALDRGDAVTALKLGSTSTSVECSRESDFKPGEPRVWDFVLDAESAARKSGAVNNQIALAGGQVGSGCKAKPGWSSKCCSILHRHKPATSARLPKSKRPKVSSAARRIRRASRRARNATGNAAEGERLFDEGMKALSQGDHQNAREKFVQAWKFESQMDLNTRRQLKDKLTLLQPARCHKLARRHRKQS